MSEFKIMQVEGSYPATLKIRCSTIDSLFTVKKPLRKQQERKCKTQSDSKQGKEIKKPPPFIIPTVDQLKVILHRNNVSSLKTKQKMEDSTSKMDTSQSMSSNESKRRSSRLQNLLPNFNYFNGEQCQSQLKEKVKSRKRRYLTCEHLDPECCVCILEYYHKLEKSKRAKKGTVVEKVKVPWCVRRMWANAELEKRSQLTK